MTATAAMSKRASEEDLIPKGPVISRVERTATFRRHLEKHRSRPGRPAEAARKAEGILGTLAAESGLCPWEAGSLTRSGDARIPGCVKFELGGGYRLICRRRGGTLVALFIGNHEECHSWLRVYRGLDAAMDDFDQKPDVSAIAGREDDKLTFEPSPELPEAILTDRELRAVFRGLCGD